MLEGEGVIVLNDRREPRSGVTITNIAVSPGGVFVVDAKHSKGLVHTRRSGPMTNLGPGELHVGRKNCTPWLERVQSQVEVVRGTLEEMTGGSEVPVHAMLCLTRAEWVVASPVEIRGVCVGWPQLIVERVHAGSLMDSRSVREVSVTIAEHLEAA
jgi:hypothetical protein